MSFQDLPHCVGACQKGRHWVPHPDQRRWILN